MSSETPTPRTDAAAECHEVYDSAGQPYTMLETVSSQFARQLEMELIKLRGENNHMRGVLQFYADEDNWSEVGGMIVQKDGGYDAYQCLRTYR